MHLNAGLSNICPLVRTFHHAEIDAQTVRPPNNNHTHADALYHISNPTLISADLHFIPVFVSLLGT